MSGGVAGASDPPLLPPEASGEPDAAEEKPPAAAAPTPVGTVERRQIAMVISWHRADSEAPAPADDEEEEPVDSAVEEDPLEKRRPPRDCRPLDEDMPLTRSVMAASAMSFRSKVAKSAMRRRHYAGAGLGATEERARERKKKEYEGRPPPLSA